MTTHHKPVFELADVVKMFGEAFERKHNPLGQHKRVLRAIVQCRTAALGGHLDVCDRCAHQRFSYNSCRNRHCPKCQGTNRERWILDRQHDLLPVPYFHVVFTLPEQLNPFCLKFPRALYSILFRAASSTMQRLGRDPKHLGAKGGMIAVLHTWGQQLWLHPHVHCIVPGGGISEAGHWKMARSKGKFLFSVKVISAMFRGKFMAMFRKFCAEENVFVEKKIVDGLYTMPWVVYAKQPFAGPAQVIEYLGRYTHRIAISNHRIKSVGDGKVSFSFMDYRNGGCQKMMTLEGCEFLRRYCMHILPPGFMKIRHYGILSSRSKPNLKMQQMKMGLCIVKKEKISWQQIAREVMGFDVEQCPCCKKGRMITILFFEAHGPPAITRPHEKK